MSLRLFLLERHVPGIIQRRLLQRLVAVTADAFGVPPPPMPDGCGDQFVEAYARFTRAEADRIDAASPDAAAIRGRLYSGTQEIGRRIRRWAGVRTESDAIRAIRLIYRAIGIDFDADPASRSVTVRRCAFSSIYTPAVCRFVSALDAGLILGVSGTWSVTFSSRITEGSDDCRGQLTGVSLT